MQIEDKEEKKKKKRNLQKDYDEMVENESILFYFYKQVH